MTARWNDFALSLSLFSFCEDFDSLPPPFRVMYVGCSNSRERVIVSTLELVSTYYLIDFLYVVNSKEYQ